MNHLKMTALVILVFCFSSAIAQVDTTSLTIDRIIKKRVVN